MQNFNMYFRNLVKVFNGNLVNNIKQTIDLHNIPKLQSIVLQFELHVSTS